MATNRKNKKAPAGISKSAFWLTDTGDVMTLREAVRKSGRGPMNESDLSIEKRHDLLIDQGKIVWSGPRHKRPREHVQIKKEVSVGGKNIFPGFIDCHTHSVFLGNRAHEFEWRNQGVTYQEIAAKGGGILSTVRQTRQGSARALSQAFQKRMENFLRQGVTTVETKSGYGLSVKDELKLLKVIRDTSVPVRSVATFLGAHALPPEFKERDDYLAELKKILPRIIKNKLSSRIDIFVEKNYFSVDEARAYLTYAQSLGFDVAIHADQLSRTGASILATELGAMSADHAICVTDEDVRRLGQSEVTCVLLPASDFYIHCPYPPARKMIDGGVRVALSTDFNPGTSPTQNIQLVGLLARLQMKMTLPEVFVALTLGGAHALGLSQQMGALVPGLSADMFISEQNFNEFFYDLSPLAIDQVWVAGNKKV